MNKKGTRALSRAENSVYIQRINSEISKCRELK